MTPQICRLDKQLYGSLRFEANREKKNAQMRRVGSELLNDVFAPAQLRATHGQTLRRTFGGRAEVVASVSFCLTLARTHFPAFQLLTRRSLIDELFRPYNRNYSGAK